MSLALSTTKTRFRYDSPVTPIITPTGITDVGKLKINQDFYDTVTNSADYNYHPLNQTDYKIIELRNVLRPSWSLGTNVSIVSSDPKKSTTNSNSGASISALETNCSIEGKATATNLLSGVSLQSGTVSFDKDSSDIEHALIFQENGVIAVYEAGNRIDYTQRNYQVNDIGLIDKQGSIIRYFLVRNGVIQLLRATRSKLDDDDIKGVIILYHIDAQLSEAYIYVDEKTSLTIETIGVLENFQDWFNDWSLTSTAESLVAQDGNISSTFSNGKKRIRSLSATRNVINKTDAEVFRQFFEYHGNEKDFIFIDKAKDEWFWATFASPFGNKSRPSCLAAENASVIESFRKDVILLEDVIPPSIPLSFSMFGETGSPDLETSWEPSVDEDVDHYELEITLG